MADIFISYSTHDRDKAVNLSRKLREAGFSVWIDESGISAATQWSSEIVKAIESCKVFFILLSAHSFGSHNVIKELSLASEEKKHIIPVELEPVELTHQVKYQLAGIQRVSYKDYDQIEDAVRRLIGDDSVVSPAPSTVPTPVKKYSSVIKISAAVILLATVAFASYYFIFRKSEQPVPGKRTSEIKKLVVLPFESLSSDKEDEYFADGLTAQVITTLSGLSGLQVIDRKTSMQYKGRKSDLHAIAKELGIRYVVDGTVQKQGKSLKITSQLIDVDSGKVIRSDQYEGTMEDVFALEEKLARSIAFELQGSLVRQSVLDSSAAHQSTKNPEAYNKFLLGIGYLENIRSEAQLMKGLGFIEEAVKIDPKFAYGQYFLSLGYMIRYQGTDSLPYLQTADSLAHLANRTDPTLAEPHLALATIAKIRGLPDTALREAEMYVELKPDDFAAQSFVANIFYERGAFDQAAAHFEKAVQKNITDLSSWSILIDCYQALGDTAKRNKNIDESRPLFELYLEKHPDNTAIRAQFALNLANRNLKEDAHREIDLILKSSDLSNGEYYNIACTYSRLGETKQALAMLEKAVSIGFNSGEAIMKDPDLTNLHDVPEFKDLVKKMQASKRPHNSGIN